jgi:hypothetical protein
MVRGTGRSSTGSSLPELLPDLRKAMSRESETDAKRVVAVVMRAVGEKLGNTSAVARSSYVSPGVVEQYLEGRTLDDFRLGICASSALAIRVSIVRSKRC